MSFKPPEYASEGSAKRRKRLAQRGRSERLQEFIAHHQYRIGDIGRKPAPETMAALGCRGRHIFTALEPLEIAPHIVPGPGWIAGELSDMIPVAAVRIDHDHRAVGGASAQRCASRIKHAVARDLEFLVTLLLGVVSVMAHEEIPGKTLVFRGARMKCRDLAVVGFLVTTGLEQQHPEARERQIGG